MNVFAAGKSGWPAHLPPDATCQHSIHFLFYFIKYTIVFVSQLGINYVGIILPNKKYFGGSVDFEIMLFRKDTELMEITSLVFTFYEYHCCTVLVLRTDAFFNNSTSLHFVIMY